MSALGHKRTWRCQIVMSALPPKADIRPRDQDICFGPKADSCTANKFMRTGNSFAALTVNANLYEAKKFSCLGHLGQKGQSVL
jgi:hypothetical protein